MQVGYGVTVWEKSKTKGHFDGIGIYSRELYHALQPLLSNEGTQMFPMGFGLTQQAHAQALGSQYEWHVLTAVCLKQRLSLQKEAPLDFFHATDHHIPFLKNVPVVATLMDIIPLLHPEWVSNGKRAIKNWFFKQAILSADHLITISEHSKKDIVRFLGVPQENISVTPLGVNPLYFEQIPAAPKNELLDKHGLKAGFFLFVGTLQPRKNLDTLLDAHALLSPELQKKHPLVIVGQVGWKVESLLKKIEERSLEKKVVWLKYLPQIEVRALLQSALALMFISLYEGFGLPVLEAFASRCPVIASNTTSIPEVAGEAAYLVNPQDRSAVAAAMMNLIENEGLFESMIEKGQERATLFSWEQCAKATLSVYKKASPFLKG